MFYVTIKWLAPTLKSYLVPNKFLFYFRCSRLFLPLRWLFLLIIVKTNSGRKVLCVSKRSTFTPGDGEKTTIPSTLASRKRLMKRMSTENTGLRASLGSKNLPGFCANTCSLLLSPHVIYRLEAEDQWKTQRPKGQTVSPCAKYPVRISPFIFLVHEMPWSLQPLAPTHVYNTKPGMATATIVKYRILVFSTCLSTRLSENLPSLQLLMPYFVYFTSDT